MIATTPASGEATITFEPVGIPRMACAPRQPKRSAAAILGGIGSVGLDDQDYTLDAVADGADLTVGGGQAIVADLGGALLTFQNYQTSYWHVNSVTDLRSEHIAFRWHRDNAASKRKAENAARLQIAHDRALTTRYQTIFMSRDNVPLGDQCRRNWDGCTRR